ncbi:MAG: hypothetical protein HY782_18690 [Chloroflexi bacterium]|nr:hypothetical protein [Chloroflexota bacterium]
MQTYLKGYLLRAGILAGIVGAIVLLLSLIPLVGFCFALIAWIVYVGAGVLAAMWGKGAGALITPQQGAIDGAIAGAIAGVIANGVKFLGDMALGVVFNVALSGDTSAFVTSLISMVVFGIIGVIVGIIVAAILGAIGGLVYNALQQQQQKPVV